MLALRPTTRLARGDFYQDVAAILSQRHTLTDLDINEFKQYYGYSPNTHSSNLMRVADQPLEEAGVILARHLSRLSLVKYIYADGNYYPEETDFHLTKALLIAMKLDRMTKDPLGSRTKRAKYERMGLETREFQAQPGQMFEPHRHGGVRLFTIAGSADIRLDGGAWQTVSPGVELVIADGQLHEARAGNEDWQYILATTAEEMAKSFN